MPNESYRVTMLADGQVGWKTWTLYRDLDAAIDAARALLMLQIANEAKVERARGGEKGEVVLHLVLRNGVVEKEG